MQAALVMADCISSFADRVLDIGLGFVEALKIKVGGCSYNPLDCCELSCATRDESDLCGGELPRGALHNVSKPGKELIAVLHHEHKVLSGASIAVG